MPDKMGLYSKYRVFDRETGREVRNCFVLRPYHDEAACAALQAYAAATKDKKLAKELYEWVGRPMQVPMQLEEICNGPVCIEFRNKPDLENALFDPDDNQYPGMVRYSQFGVNCRNYVDIHLYGSFWRCWANWPTEEERAAEPWEGNA